MAKSPGYYLRFPCPECGVTQKVLPAQAGTEIRCSDCPAVIVVPSVGQLNALSKAPTNSTRKPSLKPPAPAKDASKPAAPREVKVVRGHLVTFACPTCHTTMRTSEEELGHKTMCPHCFSPVIVGGENAANATQASRSASLVLEDPGDDDYQLADPEPRPAGAAPFAPVESASPTNLNDDDEFRLSDVEERPRAPVNFGDLEPEAPGPREIRRPQRTPQDRSGRKPAPVAKRDDISQSDGAVADPWSVEERKERPELEERLRAAQPDRGSGEIPDHPFVSGIFNFLWQASTLPRWIGLAAGTAIIYFLTSNFIQLMDQGGGMLFYAVLCAALAAAGGLVLVMVGSMMMLAVVQDTAAGNQIVESWPDYVFLDWVGQAFYVINAVAFSALPGFLLSSFLGEGDAAARWIAAAGSVALLFPIVLLSQLDGASPFSILSAGVLKSMFYAPLAWLAFYGMATLVLAASLGGIWLTAQAGGYASIITAVVAGVLGSALLLLLSRLIGRLGMFCEEEEVVVPSPRAESDENEETVIE